MGVILTCFVVASESDRQSRLESVGKAGRAYRGSAFRSSTALVETARDVARGERQDHSGEQNTLLSDSRRLQPWRLNLLDITYTFRMSW